MTQLNTCDASGLTCLTASRSLAEYVSEQAFKAVLFLFVCATAASLSRSRRKKRTAFASYVLFGMVVIQYYHLYIAQNISFPVDGVATPVSRHSCLESAKGGKRRLGDESDCTLNPCWCHQQRCESKSTGSELPASSCPKDGIAKCFELSTANKERVISMRVSDKRDCSAGQGGACTASEPCTPCEVSKAATFGLLGVADGTWERCTACSPDNRGDCNFVPDVGPYCLESPTSSKVVPCTLCCTEAEPAFVDGLCA